MEDAAIQAAEMIALRLRREFYSETTPGPIWLSLVKLSRAEAERHPWMCSSRHRRGQSGLRYQSGDRVAPLRARIAS
jgi:hypothetical protein